MYQICTLLEGLYISILLLFLFDDQSDSSAESIDCHRVTKWHYKYYIS